MKAFLIDHAVDLSLAMSAKDLQTIKETTTPTGSVHRFQQLKDGIPVYGTEILVRLDNSKRITQVNLNHVSPAKVAAPAREGPVLDAKAAIKAATEAVGKPALRKKVATPSKVYYPTPDGLRLAYAVMVLADQPARDLSIIVDAYTGEVLSKSDLTEFEDGEGFVFDPNPVVTSGNNALRAPEATVTPCGFAGSSQATIDAQRVTRTLKGITKSGTKYSLVGDYVKIQNSPEETDKNNFKYQSNLDGFEGVMAYYHLDTIQRYIQSLGINNAHNSQIDVVPHASQSAASYNSGDDTIRLGHSGPCKPDRGEDAEAMIHEYGHAIQHNQVPGWGHPGSEPGSPAPDPGSMNPITNRFETKAMGEGFSDILACVYFAPEHQFQREVFEDWCFADEGGMRRVDGTKMYPADWDPGTYPFWGCHNNGEIWSAALWNIYRAIGGDNFASLAARQAARDEVLKTVILSHFNVAFNASMPDAAEQFMLENHDLSEYRLRNGIHILNSFHDRGILQCSSGSDLKIEALWSQQNELPEVGWQQVEYGQDNWFYVRVRNDGTQPARAFVVTFSFKSPFSTPIYPSDFRDNIISAAAGFNLNPGASATLTARWPKELIPPIPTGASKLHGCIFAEVYNPVDHVPAGATTIGASNGKLRYRNTDVIDLAPDDFADCYFTISSYHAISEQVVRMEVIRPPNLENLEVTFHHRDPQVIKALWQDMQAIESAAIRPREEIAALRSELKILDSTRIAVGLRPEEPSFLLNLARGSTIAIPDKVGKETRAIMDADFTRQDADMVALEKQTYLKLRSGLRVGWPYLMKPRERLTLKMRVKAPKGAKPGDRFKVEVLQRDVEGVLIGGFDLQINIVDKS
ncbi:MAG TPA: M36 family metallopeptidase [Methanotrichaceae archaeon]|nr:M36 family metallopeptidase [Methanotrichaceae archaeon]